MQIVRKNFYFKKNPFQGLFIQNQPSREFSLRRMTGKPFILLKMFFKQQCSKSNKSEKKPMKNIPSDSLVRPTHKRVHSLTAD